MTTATAPADAAISTVDPIKKLFVPIPAAKPATAAPPVGAAVCSNRAVSPLGPCIRNFTFRGPRNQHAQPTPTTLNTHPALFLLRTRTHALEQLRTAGAMPNRHLVEHERAHVPLHVPVAPRRVKRSVLGSDRPFSSRSCSQLLAHGHVRNVGRARPSRRRCSDNGWHWRGRGRRRRRRGRWRWRSRKWLCWWRRWRG